MFNEIDQGEKVDARHNRVSPCRDQLEQHLNTDGFVDSIC